MFDIQRVRKVINWYIFQEYGKNDAEIAAKLGYTKSSFSQILGGKVPISQNFIDKLCSLDSNINKVWLSGEGEMFRNYQKIGNIDNSNVVGANVNGTGINISGTSSELIDVIKEQQKQIGELIGIINRLVLLTNYI